MGAAQTSWSKRELPPFDRGPDGFPRPGQVLRHFRQNKLKADGKPWTQRDVAQLLDCRELAVREMELRDTGLNDVPRRRLLAELLAIPPRLLGLATVPETERTPCRVVCIEKQATPVQQSDGEAGSKGSDSPKKTGEQ